MLIVFRSVLALLTCLTFVVSAEAGLLSKLGKLGDEAGEAARRTDGAGSKSFGDLPDTALRAAKDPNGEVVALTLDGDSLRLTDELGRHAELPLDADLGAILKKASPGGSASPAVVADAKTIALAGPVARALSDQGLLKIWHGGRAMRVRSGAGGLYAEPRAGVRIPLRTEIRSYKKADGSVVRYASTANLDETLGLMARPLNRGLVNVATLGKSSNRGPRRVGFGDTVRPGETLTLTPEELLQGLATHRGGTVVLAGKSDGDVLRAPGGLVPLADIRAAAAAADVHLILVDGAPKAAHALLAKADTYGDLVAGLAGPKRPLVVDVVPVGEKRIRMMVTPETSPTTSAGSPSVAEDVANVAAHGAEIAIHAAVRSIQIHTHDEAERRRQSQLIFGVFPVWGLVLYAVNAVIGLYGVSFAWRFWKRVWDVRPGRPIVAYLPRLLVFSLIFLPLTGLIWGIVGFFASIGSFFGSVFRLLGLMPRKPAG